MKTQNDKYFDIPNIPPLRFSYSNFGNLTLIICSIISLTLLFVIPSPSFAATKVATPSAIEKEVINTPTPTENLEAKIKNLVKENLSATESNLKEAINQKSLIGHLGTIKSIALDNISIETRGNVFQITTTNKTIITKAGVASKLSSLAISDKVIIVGTLVKDDIIQAKVIKTIVEETDIVETNAIIATVFSVDTKKKIVVLTVGKSQISYTLSKKNTVSIETLKPDQAVFVITKKYQGKDSLSRAKII